MNKKIVAFSCVAALAATSSLAAMGTGLGLPITWTMSARGYGAQVGIAGNPASAMCVECHTVNPSSHILDVENGKAYDIARTLAKFQGSHAVINDQSATSMTSNSGGGWADAVNAQRNGGEYLKNTAWPVNAAAISKVEDGGVVGLNSGLASVVLAADQGVICESCHSVRYNVLNGAGDNDLLFAAYQDNTTDTICTGCHNGNAALTMAVDNGNLKAFDNVSVKRHHVVTGSIMIDDAAHYQGGGTDSLMWAPYASDRLAIAWCANPYTAQAADTTLDIVAGAGILFRGQCNVGGQGSRLIANTVGDITPTAANAINCANCHRPHNAMSGAGAFILRSGKSTVQGNAILQDFAGSPGALMVNAPGMDDSAGANMYYGIRRQRDVDTYTTRKVYGEYVQLCNGCHIGYNVE